MHFAICLNFHTAKQKGGAQKEQKSHFVVSTFTALYVPAKHATREGENETAPVFGFPVSASGMAHSEILPP